MARVWRRLLYLRGGTFDRKCALVLRELEGDIGLCARGDGEPESVVRGGEVAAAHGEGPVHHGLSLNPGEARGAVECTVEWDVEAAVEGVVELLERVPMAVKRVLVKEAGRANLAAPHSTRILQ